MQAQDTTLLPIINEQFCFAYMIILYQKIVLSQVNKLIAIAMMNLH